MVAQLFLKFCNIVLKCSILCNYHAKNSDYGSIHFCFILEMLQSEYLEKQALARALMSSSVSCNIAILHALFLF